MTFAEVLAEVARAEVRLEARGGRLRFHPRERVTSPLVDALWTHKGDLVAALVKPTGPCPVCKSAVVIRTAAGPVVCPCCCPVPSDAVAEKLVWRNDLTKMVSLAGELTRLNRERWMAADRGHIDGDPAPEAGPRCRCGSMVNVDVSIHDEQSMRRDCAKCGRFLDFVVWYGRKTASQDDA